MRALFVIRDALSGAPLVLEKMQFQLAAFFVERSLIQDAHLELVRLESQLFHVVEGKSENDLTLQPSILGFQVPFPSGCESGDLSNMIMNSTLLHVRCVVLLASADPPTFNDHRFQVPFSFCLKKTQNTVVNLQHVDIALLKNLRPWLRQLLNDSKCSNKDHQAGAAFDTLGLNLLWRQSYEWCQDTPANVLAQTARHLDTMFRLLWNYVEKCSTQEQKSSNGNNTQPCRRRGKAVQASITATTSGDLHAWSDTALRVRFSSLLCWAEGQMLLGYSKQPLGSRGVIQFRLPFFCQQVLPSPPVPSRHRMRKCVATF
jgi:hypothetical protein